jgi:hypothetical protein
MNFLAALQLAGFCWLTLFVMLALDRLAERWEDGKFRGRKG